MARARTGQKRVPPTGGAPAESARKRWSRRGVGWLLALVSLVVAGIAGAFGTDIYNHATVIYNRVTGGSSAPPAEQPLTVAAVLTEDYCNQRFVVPAAPADITPPAAGTNRATWLLDQGGVGADSLSIELTLNAQPNAPVLIRNVRAVVDGPRKPPMSGTLAGFGCGGPTEYRFVAADLDRDPPKMTSDVVNGDFDTSPKVQLSPLTYPYEVTAAHAEAFYVQGHAHQDVRWHIEIDWSALGSSGTLTVYDPHGKPFHTTGIANVTGHCTWSEELTLHADATPGCRAVRVSPAGR